MKAEDETQTWSLKKKKRKDQRGLKDGGRWERRRAVVGMRNIGGEAAASSGIRSGQETCAGRSPCVCFGGEDALHEGFRWHPLHRQHGAPTLPVIAGPVHTKAPHKGIMQPGFGFIDK